MSSQPAVLSLNIEKSDELPSHHQVTAPTYANYFSGINSIKVLVLFALCIQNSSYTLLRKYSTRIEHVSKNEILLGSEAVKLLFSVYMIYREEGEPSQANSSAQGTGVDRIVWLAKNSAKMFMLAFTYVVINIVAFIAIQYLGPGEYSVLAQLKILTTAGFSVSMLGTEVSSTKWRALLLLVLGCILVASPSFTMNYCNSSNSKGDSSNSNKDSRNEAAAASEHLSLLLGYAMVFIEVALSGFSSIFFEKVLKSSAEVVSIWERNFQLSLHSLAIYALLLIAETQFMTDGSNNAGITSSMQQLQQPQPGPFQWSLVTCLVVVLGAAGGLLVAATLKYADSILKTIATAFAIILATVLGHFLLDGPLTFVIVVGVGVTLLAICNYTLIE